MKYFVYFSASGNGDFIANFLKEKGYEIVKVETLKPFGKVNFFRILKYGFRAGAQKREKIKDINLELNSDDEVVIGSPIWNDRLSTPINAVLDQIAFNKETTKFLVYPAGEKANKVFEQIEKLGFKNKPFVYPNPLKNQDKINDILNYLGE